jgi:hypothetical protein
LVANPKKVGRKTIEYKTISEDEQEAERESDDVVIVKMKPIIDLDSKEDLDFQIHISEENSQLDNFDKIFEKKEDTEEKEDRE